MDSQVIRERYLRQLDYLDRGPGSVKVLTGMRSCGKSTILRQYSDLLVSRGIHPEEILHIDLESVRSTCRNRAALEDLILTAGASRGMYIMLDDVQLVDGWEPVAERFARESEADVIVTFSGWFDVSVRTGMVYTVIRVYPFSFSEYLSMHPAHGRDQLLRRLREYTEWGGMPGLPPGMDAVCNEEYLDSTFQSAVNKTIRTGADLMQGILEKIMDFVSMNLGENAPYLKVAQWSGIREPRTTCRYLDELCRAGILFKAEKYDFRHRRYLNTNPKFYCADTGLLKAVSGVERLDPLAALQNVVYMELVRRGFRVDVGGFGNRGVDFIVWHGADYELYQVMIGLDDPEAVAEKVSYFSAIGRGHGCTLLYAAGEAAGMPEGVRAANVADWLLDVRGDSARTAGTPVSTYI